ncbi:MAG: peptidoglycan DD-metalloendopeptidase family protein [Alcaligenaceae bacterium]|nr:peptidoglycan DD-metalloendopeptidase family protein [Alcaligenaceae bacterium]
MLRAFATLALALWAGQVLGNSAAELQQRQTEARQQQDQLRERIEALSRDIQSSEASRRDAAEQLKASEQAISNINRELANLESRRAGTETSLKDAQARQVEQTAELKKRRAELADQLRAQYAAGLSPWTALLSGDNPQAISRELSYLGYVSRAQARAVQAVQTTLNRLAELEKTIKENRTTLTRLAAQVEQQKKDLQTQQNERKAVLARIESQLKDQRTQAQRMEQNDARLGKLIAGLDKTIAQQREAERIAAEKRRAEQARLAAEKRRQEEERRQEAQRRLDAQRRLEEQRRLEAQRSQGSTPGQADGASSAVVPGTESTVSGDASLVRSSSVEQASADRTAADKPSSSDKPPAERIASDQPAAGKPSSREPPSADTPSAEKTPAEPSGGFAGLSKGLPAPVKSTSVLGRFGSARPDGGVWRGIVLMAPEGTPVRAVAPGRVVYSTWMTGFGNILILDHGQKYLSVYAYNQALLKQVGDTVRAGETVARVGATGGQVESGLYFEIRHQGAPINPQVWLKR